ncbi:hypothetical protein KQX54_017373 [Cotesia glomerata]|uniref:Uncharacterized protein n=1 Tax=Cotesia glomerata TaxID=32391 RepID=A0AAV7ICU7_COTGL|nr:hypothetical protein KQX54_017373 [Cotesia glomerata]
MLILRGLTAAHKITKKDSAIVSIDSGWINAWNITKTGAEVESIDPKEMEYSLAAPWNLHVLSIARRTKKKAQHSGYNRKEKTKRRFALSQQRAREEDSSVNSFV